MRLTPILRSHKAKFPADFSTNGNWPYRCRASAWRNGRRASLRSWCPKGRGGSNPLADTTIWGGLEVLDLHRLDLVRELKTEDPREEVELALRRAPDSLVLAKPVLLAFERHVREGQLLLPARGHEHLGLVGRHDLVLETLEQDARRAQPVGEVDRRARAVHVSALRIRADQRVAVVRLELMRLLHEQLEVGDPVVARARVVEVALGQRQQHGETSRRPSGDGDAIGVDESLLHEMARCVDAVVDVDDAPVAVEALPVPAHVTRRAAVVHIDQGETAARPVLVLERIRRAGAAG